MEPYNIWGMKEPDYVCKMFEIAGGMHEADEQEHARVWTENGIEKRKIFKDA